MAYKIGIVGATGAVGQELIALLSQRSFPVAELKLLASARSAGKTITYGDQQWIIGEACEEAFAGLDLVFFSAGAGTSRELCPAAVKAGAIVVDNSSAFRMDPDVPLVVPEVNPHAVREHKGILANPNCSTAIALMGLAPLHQAFGLKRFIACTYQAVSGTGVKGMIELEEQVRAWTRGEIREPSTYPHPIAFNVFPHVDVFLDDGYTKEEMKMCNESRKIMGLGDLAVSTTCVRVPVLRAHSIAIHAEFERPVDLAAARAAIDAFPGVRLEDDVQANRYPVPVDLAGQWNCAVGRIRKDKVFGNGLALWVVGDQLLKGAALNAIQIAELMHKEGLLPRH
jgi:aspartate-semialdehyde dehydrogenase